MCFAHRWVIEEYHKCLYSGCAVFARQLTTAVGWRASPRIFSNCGEGCFYNCVCSVALSQNVWLFPVIPPLLLQVLVARLGLFSVELTLGQFWLALARLGGFLARQSDGLPGWQTLWRGWQRLQDLCWGATFAAGVS